MTLAVFLKNNPLLRLAIPLMAGIVVAWFCGVSLQIILILLLLGLLLVFAGMFDTVPHTLFGLGAMIFMFSAGAFVEYDDEQQMRPRWSGEKGRFEAVLQEAPQMGDRTTKILAMVERVGRDSVQGMRRKGLVNIYIANCVEAERLRVGERIFFEAKVEAPHNAGNPAEFDTEHYLYVNGVTGTVYLPVDGWQSRGTVPLTLRMQASRLREYVIGIYERLGFTAREFAVLSALTVGDKSSLDKQLKDIYASVGASHILALSGLHLGILYMIVSLLVPVGGGRRCLFVLREFFILALLWGGAFMAGLSPSVVRAAILFTLVSLGRCLRQEASSVNSLAFAAIIMLLYSPRYLFDVSFQLSFSAVLAILLLVPTLQKFMRSDDFGSVWRYFSGLFAVSLAAQVAVLPFVWYYFGLFPPYFLLTNIVVVPAAFVIMLLAVLMLFMYATGLFPAAAALLLNNIIALVNGALSGIAEFPCASLQLPHIGLPEACVVALLLFLFFYGLFARRRVWAFVSVGAVLLSVGVFVVRNFERDEPPYILFYNSREFPAAQLVYSPERSYMLSSVPSLDVELDYVSQPYCRREGIAAPRWINDDYSDAVVSYSGGLLLFYGRKIKLLADDCWLDEGGCTPVDCLFLCRGFLGKISELCSRYPTRCIILDATLHAGSRRRILRECAQLGVRCVDLKNEGAFKLHCADIGLHLESMRGK